MLDFTDVNKTSITGAVAIFTLKERLKAVGWTVMSSSDGTTYNASGDQITTGASGAGGMANNSAWFRIRMPIGNLRELCFQRGTANTDWYVTYAFQFGFQVGSPDATHTPEGTWRKNIIGSGSPAVPTFASWFAADGGYRYHAIAGRAAEGYGFISLAYQTGAIASHALILDPIAPSHPGDADPYVFVCSNTGGDGLDVANLSNLAAAAPLAPRAWIKPTLSLADFNPVAALKYRDSAADVAPTAAPDNPITGAKEVLPILYAARTGAPAGVKGWSTFLHWVAGTALTKWGTLSIGGGSKNMFNATHVTLPWKGDGTDPLA